MKQQYVYHQVPGLSGRTDPDACAGGHWFPDFKRNPRQGNVLIDVGLDYLSMTRATEPCLAARPSESVLATQIGSGLVGVAYILDEPSIGLHQRDNDIRPCFICGIWETACWW